MKSINYHKLFSGLGLGASPDPLKARPRPYRDWHALMIGWFVFLVITSVIHFWLFQQIKSKLNQDPTSNQGLLASKLDPVRLHKVLETWRGPTATSTKP